MKTVNIHEAKTHLSRLIADAVARGEDFVIARAGRPLVRVSAIEPPERPARIGFMAESLTVPDDFDTLDAADIADMFDGNGPWPS